MQGVAAGYLAEPFLAPGLKAFDAVLGSLEMKDGLLSMPLISAPTIARPTAEEDRKTRLMERIKITQSRSSPLR